MCLKYMKGIFSFDVTWQLFLDTLAVILRKKSEIVGEIFSSNSGNATCSILLKYQETFVQIQTLTDEN